MRLGGPLFRTDGNIYQRFEDAGEWIAAIKKMGYTAAYCPVNTDSSSSVKADFRAAAEKEEILIAEVGAWSNPLSLHPGEREAAIQKCQNALALADEMGACCCVNISGSRAEKWDGPSPQNLTSETFDMIVESVREIVDAVRPRTASYTLETMPWMFPDSADSYLDLLKAIDRKAFAVHFDPVNLISSPQRYFSNADLIRDFVKKLGPHIKSCHAKDISLSDTLTVKLIEVRPGLGALDYAVFLGELNILGRDIPVMLEHLNGCEEYAAAAAHLKKVASRWKAPAWNKR
ncbi:MAG: sugar phosphate isomerase/epimerase [Spirochaetia bacterium]|nr:sugar phosphate isomerase/epimerase [Spirochaetia bacterium]